MDELDRQTRERNFRFQRSKDPKACPGRTSSCFRKDGSRFPVEFVKTSINENGRVVGSVVVFKDITERKRVQDSLAQQSRRAGQLER